MSRGVSSSSASLRSPVAVRWNLRAGGNGAAEWSTEAQAPAVSSFSTAS